MTMAGLTTLQLEQLKALIDEREHYLRDNLSREAAQLSAESYADIAGAGADSGDTAVADVAIDTENALMGRALAELGDIAAARARLDDGSYGKCVACGGDIFYARLAAYPTVKRCAGCQTEYEHRRPNPRTSTL